jgi:asparagine synthase (glutamine-hydrolysing)
MCGIVGIVAPPQGAPIEKERVWAMAHAIVHRGPDDAGFYLTPEVCLGMRRLSIIDLPSGHQPIGNEDGRLQVVFNGEIYNYRMLQEELRSRGHQLRTASDTEVLVHLYEEHGDELVNRLNGMFAFALWDERRRRLLLARDRMGEKPLYFTQLRDGTFLFASELKALLTHPRVERRLDLLALRKYLQYEFVPAPCTILEGIFKLPPAHRLIVEGGRWRMERYWQLPDPGAPRPISLAEAAEELRERLREAVRIRLIADVPLGILLSGGIDSSTVAALACQEAGRRVETFSIAFSEKSFDESAHARQVAAHLGTHHHEATVTEQEMLAMVARIPSLLDEPLGDASLIPTFLLSQFTRRHVTVALGGDGGDELLAGYPTYFAHRLAESYRRLPSWLRRGAIEPLIARLPVSTANLSFDFKAKRFVQGAALPLGLRHTVWMGSFTSSQQVELLLPEILAAVPDEQVYKEITPYNLPSPIDPVERMMRLDAGHYLSEGVLVKVDRASMAASLETRAPFLDHTLVEFLCGLPLSLKLRGSTGKVVLKEAMRNDLPASILARPKKGFGMPVAQWLQQGLRPLVRETLSPDRLRRQGIFSPSYVTGLLAEHESGRADHRKLLWTLLMFELWPFAPK